jgi:hypothetical protein
MSEKVTIESKIDNYFYRLSLKDNDILEIHRDIPNIYGESTELYTLIISRVIKKTKLLNKKKALLYRKFRQNMQFDLKKGEIEEYYLYTDDDITELETKIEMLELHIKRLDKLFQLLNNMSFITGNFIKIQERRGVKI